MKKRCAGCAKKLTLENFSVRSASKDGRQSYCKKCARAKHSAYQTANRADLTAKAREWREAKPVDVGRRNKLSRERYAANREAIRAYQNTYCRENRTDATRAKEKLKRANNANVNLRNRLAPRLNRTLHGRKAGVKTAELLGYGHQELKAHLQLLFTQGMSWKKFMAGEIVIDHVVPLTAFKLTSIDDPMIKHAWGLKNLQPLWKADNLRKGDSMPKPLPRWYTKLTRLTTADKVVTNKRAVKT